MGFELIIVIISVRGVIGQPKRDIYNKYGEEGLKQHMASGGRGGGMGMDISDIFKNFFGGGGDMEEEERMAKGDDVIVELDATLEDLYMGGSQKVCDQCQNVKYEREGYFITVDIEKGMQDGQEVVFYEDGEPIIDGEPGDLRFRIRAEPHDHFRREGSDLHTTVTITLVQALVGFEKTLKHLDEHLVDISTKGITKPKAVRKFKGEGMPLHSSTKKGDLYVTFEVLFPNSLTKKDEDQGNSWLGYRIEFFSWVAKRSPS
ncbi:hypothetical protein GH714_037851 [Hevea brasiliensis]|uniref:Chaperone DnaJ C-terminal domain-containing protein n=1 Tax=Hevea brasiliensis TaxID=3981 RepID=A0A6A6LTG8_HEVBR|nr:hypothetical protein GH714_037851 [Hevea brasiliensis]